MTIPDSIPPGDERATLIRACVELARYASEFNPKGKTASVVLALHAFDTMVERLTCQETPS